MNSNKNDTINFIQNYVCVRDKNSDIPYPIPLSNRTVQMYEWLKNLNSYHQHELQYIWRKNHYESMLRKILEEFDEKTINY